MNKKRPEIGVELDVEEKTKRRREWIAIGGLAVVLLFLTWFLFRLFSMSDRLPLQHSVFFFGLVNFNIILFLLLTFLIFRNVVKNFADREGGPLGSSLKSKLIAAFVGFSFVPTALMFLVSVFYINNSFDRWFNERISGVLKNSIEVTNNYYLNSKRKNYHFAEQAASTVKKLRTRIEIQTALDQLQERYSLDAVEYYPDLFSDRILSYAKTDGVPLIPPVSLEFRQKGIMDKNESSFVHHFEEGDLIRVIVPVRSGSEAGAIVVSSYVPLSLVAQMDDIASAFENFRDTDPLAYPIKSIYLIILVLMTLMILLGATWFGFYLARQLSVPLDELGHATQRVVQGEYQRVALSTGSTEINRLIGDFNTMTDFLERSENEVKSANDSLRQTLSQLDEHNRYMEVVLSHVTTGVISIDLSGVVTMINRHAARLLAIEPADYLNKRVDEVLPPEYHQIFIDLLDNMKNHEAATLQKEIQISVRGQSVLLSMTVTLLKDDSGKEVGRVLVFDDLTPLLGAQRAAAWAEVARRIAHEIKNPLTPISLAAQRLQRKFGASVSDPAFAECTEMIVNQVDGLKMLVNEFSQFARMPRAQPIRGSLNQNLVTALQLFHQSDRNYVLRFDADPKIPEFMFDPDLITRAVMNLVDNAVEGVKDVPNAEIVVQTTYDPLSKIVRLVVSDNGRGIPSKLLPRLFEPYVTTKRQGTGLGLAIVKRTVEDHNGYIRVMNNEPTGTRFVIELPAILDNTANTAIYSKNLERGENV